MKKNRTIENEFYAFSTAFVTGYLIVRANPRFPGCEFFLWTSVTLNIIWHDGRFISSIQTRISNNRDKIRNTIYPGKSFVGFSGMLWFSPLNVVLDIYYIILSTRHSSKVGLVLSYETLFGRRRWKFLQWFWRFFFNSKFVLLTHIWK